MDSTALFGFVEAVADSTFDAIAAARQPAILSEATPPTIRRQSEVR